MSDVNEDTLDLSDVSKIDAEDPAVVQRIYREYLNSLFVLVKSGLIFETNNPTLHQACDRVARVANAILLHFDRLLEIYFLADGIYVNHELLKLRGKRFEMGEYVSAVWTSFGVQGIVAKRDTVRDDWLELISALRRYASGSESSQGGLVSLRFDAFELKGADAPPPAVEVTVTDRVRSMRSYCVSVLAMRDVLERVTRGGRLRLSEIKRPLMEIISVSQECRELLVSLVHLKRHKQEDYHHFVNTAALTVVLASELAIPRETYLELATAAALHDLGRATLPEYAPEVGVDARETGWAQESICRIAVSKAPFLRAANRLAVAHDVRISLERAAQADYRLTAPARIVAVAHAYDLLTTPQPHRPALLPDEALRVLMSEVGRRYDERAVRALVNALGIYPMGSLVALSSGETGIVVGVQNEGDGNRPRIKLVHDNSGTGVTGTSGAMLNLAERADLSILGCLDAEEHAVNLPAFLLS